jgi:hypothetical protein
MNHSLDPWGIGSWYPLKKRLGRPEADLHNFVGDDNVLPLLAIKP